jgi:hypothetical protein
MVNIYAAPGALFEVAVGFTFIFNPAALHNGYEPKDGMESYAFEVSSARHWLNKVGLTVFAQTRSALASPASCGAC